MTPAIRLLDKARVPYRVLEYQHLAGAKNYGLEAAKQLNQPPAQVFKTLLAEVPAKQFIVAMVPVNRQLDLKALASAAASKRVALVSSNVAERVTGYLIGGISPLGQKRKLPAFIDKSALLFQEIYVSGGRRGLEVVLGLDHLLALTGATLAAVARLG